jgi:hypothetical protein
MNTLISYNHSTFRTNDLSGQNLHSLLFVNCASDLSTSYALTAGKSCSLLHSVVVFPSHLNSVYCNKEEHVIHQVPYKVNIELNLEQKAIPMFNFLLFEQSKGCVLQWSWNAVMSSQLHGL